MYHKKDSSADFTRTRKEHPYQTHHNHLNKKIHTYFHRIADHNELKITFMFMYEYLYILEAGDHSHQ